MVARRFKLLTDEHVPSSVIKALRQHGWHVVRCLDVLRRGTRDEVVFEYAAANGLVWVTSDERALALSSRYLEQERPFVGMLVWRQEDRYHMRPGDFVRTLAATENEPDPFAAGYRFIQRTRHTRSR